MDKPGSDAWWGVRGESNESDTWYVLDEADREALSRASLERTEEASERDIAAFSASEASAFYAPDNVNLRRAFEDGAAFAQTGKLSATKEKDERIRPRVHHLGAALQEIADTHAEVLSPRQREALHQASRSLWEAPRLAEEPGILAALEQTGCYWVIGKGRVRTAEPLYACAIMDGESSDVEAEAENADLTEAVTDALAKHPQGAAALDAFYTAPPGSALNTTAGCVNETPKSEHEGSGSAADRVVEAARELACAIEADQRLEQTGRVAEALEDLRSALGEAK